MADLIDLRLCNIRKSPNVVDWPATIAISAIWMTADGGIEVVFDRPVPDAWKWIAPNMTHGDNIQFTVWAITPALDAAGFVQMWQGRPMGDRSLPPILSGYRDWWGDPRRLWDGMSDYVPQAGDRVGFFVTAGNARLRTDVTSKAERSNVVAVTLPPDDSGIFNFSAPPAPPPTPDPPANDGQVERLIAAVERQALAVEQNTRALDAVVTKLDALKQTGVRLHW